MDSNGAIEDDGLGQCEPNELSCSEVGGFDLQQMEQLSSRLIQLPPPIKHMRPSPATPATLINANANIRDYRDLCITSKRNIATTTIVDRDNQQSPLGPILELDGLRQQQQQKRGKLIRLAGMIEISIGAFTQGKANNCVPACLLGAALVASALNIILLSFVVKSIQLNDRGFIGGKISWDEETDSTIIRLTTRLLGGKSISIKSIESLEDRPLKLETVCLGLEQADNKDRAAKDSHDIGVNNNNNRKTCLPAIQLAPIQLPIDSVGPTNNNLTSKSNYTAVSVHSTGRLPSPPLGQQKAERIRIETKLLVWDLISKSEGGNQTKDPKRLTSPINSRGIDHNERQHSGGHASWLNAAQVADRTRMLEFDTRQSMISLAREDKLNLDSAIASSMIVNEKLESPVITGSLEENLDVQTRNGNLTSRCSEAMKLVSKTGVARFSAFGDLVLSAPALTMSSAKQLYLPEGIQYLDSEPPTSIFSDMDSTGQQSSSSLADSADGPIATTASHQLRAYNLVAINGHLMASSAD